MQGEMIVQPKMGKTDLETFGVWPVDGWLAHHHES